MDIRKELENLCKPHGNIRGYLLLDFKRNRLTIDQAIALISQNPESVFVTTATGFRVNRKWLGEK